MILSFDEAGALLDGMAEEFPPEFYDELNGGIALLPEARKTRRGSTASSTSWASTATT